MTEPATLFLDYATRSDASEAAAQFAQLALADGLASRGRASLMVSGGSTPGPMFQTLANIELDWASVTIGLVDERAVSPEHAASNEGLVRRTLLQGNAAPATVLSMLSADIIDVNEQYAAQRPFDFVLLGMGTDGHTASWFPGAANLSDALETMDLTVTQIDASGCPVAGDVTDRITLTRDAVTSARQAVLLIFGNEKRDVYEAAMTGEMHDYPVRAAVAGLGPRLIVCWAP